jgi:hypothetical protein
MIAIEAVNIVDEMSNLKTMSNIELEILISKLKNELTLKYMEDKLAGKGLSEETIMLSQKLDIPIAEEQRRLLNKHKDNIHKEKSSKIIELR